MIKFLKKRKTEDRHIKYTTLTFFKTGDVIFLSYFLKFKLMHFKGICIAKKYRNLTNRGWSLSLRNVNKRIRSGMEVSVNSFCSQIYNLIIDKFERKRWNYRKAKLYYLRDKINKHSLLK